MNYILKNCTIKAARVDTDLKAVNALITNDDACKIVSFCNCSDKKLAWIELQVGFDTTICLTCVPGDYILFDGNKYSSMRGSEFKKLYQPMERVLNGKREEEA